MGSLEATRRLQVLARLDALEAEPLAGVVAEVSSVELDVDAKTVTVVGGVTDGTVPAVTGADCDLGE